MSNAKTAPAVDIVHDIVNEQIVVAAMFVVDPKESDRYLSTVRHDFFGDSKNSKVWRAMVECNRRKIKLDVAAVLSELNGAVPKSYFDTLLKTFPQRPANLADHIKTLKWSGARMQVVDGSLSELLRAFQDPSTPPAKVKALAAAVSETLNNATTATLRDSNAVARELSDALLERTKQAIYETGIEGLDKDDNGEPRLIPGFAPQKMTVLTGSSGAAKSTLANKFGLNQARKQRLVLMGQWEMQAHESLETMAVISLAEEFPHEGWSRRKATTGQLTQDQRKRLVERAEAIGQWVKYMPKPNVKNGKSQRGDNDIALNEIQEQIVRIGADVAIFDLWERVLASRDPDDERNALERQQTMAQVTNCHCILLAQQKTKDLETKDDKRPTRDLIFGTGMWVDAPDTILAPYRPHLWEEGRNDDTLEIICLKQRFGAWPWCIEFDYDPDTVQLTNGHEVEIRRGGRTRRGDFKDFGLS